MLNSSSNVNVNWQLWQKVISQLTVSGRSGSPACQVKWRFVAFIEAWFKHNKARGCRLLELFYPRSLDDKKLFFKSSKQRIDTLLRDGVFINQSLY